MRGPTCIFWANLTPSSLKLRCGHTYHASCVEGWLASHRTCPVCRATVVRPWERAPTPAPPTEGELLDQVSSDLQPAPLTAHHYGRYGL